MSQIFTFQMQARTQLIFGSRSTIISLDQAATDIFHFDGASYFLVDDYTSRCPVVCKLTSMTGQHIANQCKLIFSEYGWPETLVSDNGPCYIAELFTSLIREYNSNHITRSPHYPQMG